MARTVWILLAVAACLSACAHPSPPAQLSSVAAPGTSDSLAVALVYNGWEVWIGNDDLLPEDDPSRYPGALHELVAAVDAAQLSKRGPSDLGMLITYNDKVVIRAPMGPLSRLTGASLGTQRDYFGVKGVEMVKGVELALHELKTATATRKVLIVVGDGSDVNPEHARAELSALAAEARSNHVQIYAVVYQSALSSPDQNVVESLTPNAHAAQTAQEIRAALASVFSQCCVP